MPRRNQTHEVEWPLIGGIFFCREDVWPLGSGFVAGVDLSNVQRMRSVSGDYGLVSDEELDRLRGSSAERTAEKTSFRKGDRVLVTLGSFADMEGTVEKQAGEYCTISIDGFKVPIKFRAFLLRKIQE